MISKAQTLDGTTNITRVEVIGNKGREFSKLLIGAKYKVHIQDEGRTIKLFEKRLCTVDGNPTFDKPEEKEDLAETQF